MHSASPMASAAVVLAVGTRLSGHASSDTWQSSATSAACASVDAGLPVMAMIFAPMRRMASSRRRTSWVSPLCEMASSTSLGWMTPRSPCVASAGCRKNADVPVLASVAAIFRQMMPDLPMPVTMTRPWHSYSIRTARSKLSSRRSTSAGSLRPRSAGPCARAIGRSWSGLVSFTQYVKRGSDPCYRATPLRG